jgi:hypothetical protein
MRRHLSPALVLSVLAVILAMTAGATAASSLITGKQIKNSSVTGADVKDSSLSGDDLKSATIGPSKLSNGLLADITAPGPAGPAGPAGSAGAAGPAGPAGIANVVTVTSATQIIPPGGYTTGMRANCPAGMTVVGTGFNTGIGNADFVLSFGTFVGAFFDNDVSISIEPYVQAICASNTTNGGVAASVRSRAADLGQFERAEAKARELAAAS